MRRRALTLVSVMALMAISLGAVSATITVPDDYPTIQAAIDAAEPGDTLIIASGEYWEDPLIAIPLTIRGVGSVTIHGRIGVDLTIGAIRLAHLRIESRWSGILGFLSEDSQLACERITVLSERGSCINLFTPENSDEIKEKLAGEIQPKGSFSLRDSVLLGGSGLIGGNLFLDLGTGRVVLENNLLITLGSTGVLIVSASRLQMFGNTVIGGDGLDADGPFIFYPDFIIQGQKNTVSGRPRPLYDPHQPCCVPYTWPESFFADDPPETLAAATSLLKKSVGFYKEDKSEDGRRAYDEGIALLAEIAGTYVDLAALSYELEIADDLAKEARELELAEEWYRRARQTYLEYGFLAHAGNVAVCIGDARRENGDEGSALSWYETARSNFATARDANQFLEVTHKIVDLLADELSADRAYTLYEEARSLLKEEQKDEELAEVDIKLGKLCKELRQYDKAASYYQEAAELYDRNELKEEALDARTSLADVYRHMGQLNEALVIYEAVQHERTSNPNVKQSDIFFLDLDIADVHEAMGHFETALLAYRDLQEEVACLGIEGVPVSQSIVDIFGAYSYLGEAQCLRALGRLAEAVSACKKGVANIESARARFMDERTRQAIQEIGRPLYELLIQLLHEDDKDAECLSYAERCRARTFLDLLAKGPVGTIENVAEEGIRSGVVEPSAIKADVDEVAGSLPPDTAAIEYFVTDDATYVWVIRDGKVNGPIQLDHGRTELMDEVIACREKLDAGQEAVNRDLAILYDWLIRPVEDLLPETTGEGDVPHLIIIPSGPLYYLPFQALIWTSEDLSEHALLIERYALSYAPSLATLKYAQGLSETAYLQATFLGLADPDSGDPSIRRLPDAQTEARTVAKLFPVSSVYVDKDATEDVVQSDSATAREILLSTHGSFNSHNPMYSYLVMSPTTENKDAKLFAYEVFSLPLHADMVVLSACETLLPSLKDMKNQLNKIARRAGDNETKELTEDQLKQLTAGDEVVGLTRAFIYAGASSVLSSLWSVPSESTTQLMVSFYERMAEGMDKAHALRAAQLEVMNTTGCTQPWYWAAFNLMGDWR